MSSDALPDELYAALEQHFRTQYEAERATGPFQFRAEAKVHRVYDGDTWFGAHRPDPTLTVAMDQSHRDDGDTQDGQYYRLSGADTHELNASDDEKRAMAQEERDWVRDWVADGREAYDGPGDWPFIVIYQAKEFEGSFGRPLCDLQRKSDGARLAESVVSAFPERDLAYHASEDAREQDAFTRQFRPAVGVPWAADPMHLP